MKLRLKATGPRGTRVALCDESGEPLPGQRSLKVESEAPGTAVVTVEFVIIEGKVEIG